VNIYKVLVRDSIEEKVYELQQRKQDLADGILQGGEAAAKMTAKEMLEMIGYR